MIVASMAKSACRQLVKRPETFSSSSIQISVIRHMKLLAQDLRRDYWREFRKNALGLAISSLMFPITQRCERDP
jgi:hypothetical protein